MDDTTRTSPDQPEPRPGDATAGTGWSTPAAGSGSTPNPPWSQTGHDTGSIPRPDDTRQIPEAPSSGSPAAEAGTGRDTSGTPADQPDLTHEPGSSTQPDVTSPGDTLPPLVVPVAKAEREPSKGKRSTALAAAVVLGAGLIGGVAGAGIYAAVDDDTIAPVSSLDNEPAEATTAADMSTVQEVAASLTPSVVSIGIEGQQGVGSGSGIIISSDGQILTNAHVADAAGEDGRITVTFSDGTSAEAEVIGSDEQSDVAVIQAQDVSGLQAVDFGDSDTLDVGEEVIAFGSPLGLDGTVTRGIVSALHRPVQASDRLASSTPTLFEAIQTDASINPGNSGGPLVNMSGQVVGINSAIAATPGSEGSIGLGFAIPINTARYIAEQLIAGDDVEYARIGISVSDGDGPEQVATVAEVQEGGAADQAGLEEGDVITHINDRFMSDATALVAAARSFEPGDVVSLTFERDGEEQTVEITLGSSMDDE